MLRNLKVDKILKHNSYRDLQENLYELLEVHYGHIKMGSLLKINKGSHFDNKIFEYIITKTTNKIVLQNNKTKRVELTFATEGKLLDFLHMSKEFKLYKDGQIYMVGGKSIRRRQREVLNEC